MRSSQLPTSGKSAKGRQLAYVGDILFQRHYTKEKCDLQYWSNVAAVGRLASQAFSLTHLPCAGEIDGADRHGLSRSGIDDVTVGTLELRRAFF